MINSDTYISIHFAILISAAFGALFTTLTQSISFLKKTWLIFLDICITIIFLIYLDSIFLQRGLVCQINENINLVRNHYIQFRTFINNALSDKNGDFSDCMDFCESALFLYIILQPFFFYIAYIRIKKNELSFSKNNLLRNMAFILCDITGHIICASICIYITFILFNLELLWSTLARLMFLYVIFISSFKTKLMYEIYKNIILHSAKTK